MYKAFVNTLGRRRGSGRFATINMRHIKNNGGDSERNRKDVAVRARSLPDVISIYPPCISLPSCLISFSHSFNLVLPLVHLGLDFSPDPFPFSSLAIELEEYDLNPCPPNTCKNFLDLFSCNVFVDSAKLAVSAACDPASGSFLPTLSSSGAFSA